MDKSDEVFSSSYPVSDQRCHHVKSKALQPHPKVWELNVENREGKFRNVMCVAFQFKTLPMILLKGKEKTKKGKTN